MSINPKAPLARVTAVEQVYYQVHDGTSQPTEYSSRWGRDLSTDEQPYLRHMRVRTEWAQLDLGWVDNCAVVLLTNDEGRGLKTVPTAVEVEGIKRRVLEVCVGCPLDAPEDWYPFLIVRPGESCRFEPASPKSLRVRCRDGEARATVTAIPG